MKHTLTLLLLLTTLGAYAQWNKFRDETVVSSHGFGVLGSLGYAYQRAHLLQPAVIYGTNYTNARTPAKTKADSARQAAQWDRNIFGIGLGADISIASPDRVFAPKVFVEFETYQKTLFYRINAIQYYVNGNADMRIMPEFGVCIGSTNRLAIMAGYAQPMRKQRDEISRFKIGLNVYPGFANSVRYKVIKEKKANAEVFHPVPGIKEPDMVYVQGGTFKMGASIIQTKDKRVLRITDVPDDEQPEHEVTLPDYWIGKNEVTYAEFREFISHTGYITEKDRVDKINNGIFYQLGLLKNKQGSCFWNGAEWQNRHLNLDFDANGHRRTVDQNNHPVIYITVNDALKYCEWLSVQTGKKYRLPTEAEWEYAAAGGSQSEATVFPGSKELDEVAWHRNNSKKATHKVGTKKPNELGINDMAGNVMEMCMDWYDARYYQRAPAKNPQGPDEYRNGNRSYSIRGSSWAGTAADSRITRRNYCDAATASNVLGFRLVAEK